VARLLRAERARVVVVGRNADRVAEVARAVDGEPRMWDALAASLIEADVVVSSTASPRHVIDFDLVHRIRRQRRGRSLFFIDLAVPRDVDPRVDQLDAVFCYNVDDFARVVAESRNARAREADAAERIVSDEVDRLERWFAGEQVTPVQVALRRRVRKILEAEVARSLAGRLKHLGADERQVLQVMVHAATKKLCHAPTLRLRELAVDRVVDGDRVDLLADALVELFDLEAEFRPSDAPQEDEEGALAPPAEPSMPPASSPRGRASRPPRLESRAPRAAAPNPTDPRGERP
jgi:glutamyl-tRNA reductase